VSGNDKDNVDCMLPDVRYEIWSISKTYIYNW
jgi:hypothetical protein